MTYKRDKQATELRGFLDPRSYVSHRIHPGTEHPCEFLYGRDVGVARLEVFAREKGRCWSCLTECNWDIGEMHHLKGGLGAQRCECLENLRWSCPHCHRAKHVQVQWTKRASA